MNAAHRRQPRSWTEWIVAIALVASFALLLFEMRAPAGPSPVAAGTPMPSLASASGWINVDNERAVSVDGKLTVVDCWATWCGPCLAELPALARVARQYRPLGVEFVSVTDETSLNLEEIHRVVADSPGFDWPIAYGGADFFNELNIRAIPTLILFGPDGGAIWSHAGTGGADRLDEALDEALAAMR